MMLSWADVGERPFSASFERLLLSLRWDFLILTNVAALVQKLGSVGKLKIHYFSLPPPVHHHQYILHFLKPLETCCELSPLCWFCQCRPSALCRHITEMAFLKRSAVPFLKDGGNSDRYFCHFHFIFCKSGLSCEKLFNNKLVGRINLLSKHTHSEQQMRTWLDFIVYS